MPQLGRRLLLQPNGPLLHCVHFLQLLLCALASHYMWLYGIVVDTPPPAPYAEVVPVMPYPGAVWINGYWGWSGGRHYWVPGYYERPRPGYRYEPHRWENQGGRWHLRIGGWIRM